MRFTEKEKEQLIYQMADSGYLSVSKYLRVRCLDGKPALSRVAENDGADLGTQINVLSGEIARIGASYNALVKEFRDMLALRRKDGLPMVNTRAVTIFLQRLNARTVEVKSLMDAIIEICQTRK